MSFCDCSTLSGGVEGSAVEVCGGCAESAGFSVPAV